MSLIEDAQKRLDIEWTSVQSAPAQTTSLPIEVQEAVARSINSKAKTYRYVLPTQLLAKLVDPTLDCRSIQATSTMPGAFDARSLAQDVIVPFDRNNHSVLGGSPEPYANNPLRIPAIVPAARGAQKHKDDFDDLVKVLDFAQNNPGQVIELFDVVLRAILLRLGSTRIVFPVPNRISFEQAIAVIAAFLQDRTGGMRMQTVVSALFQAIGKEFKLFTKVLAGSINAADASTGSAADIECMDDQDRVILAVEVKDRELTLRHMSDKLPGIRSKGISELLFLVQGGVDPNDEANVASLQEKEFSAGQNLYVSEFEPFLRTCLVLLREPGRRALMILIGEELEAKGADLVHRQKWRDLLSSI